MYQILEDIKMVLFKCPDCGEEFLINVTDDELDRIKRFANKELLIQEALPDKDRTIRERFVSGQCPECWNRLNQSAMFEKRGEYFETDNRDGFILKYLVTIELENCSHIFVNVWADSAEAAINEAVINTLGIVDGLPVMETSNYREYCEAGFDEPAYDLPCGYSIIEKSVRVQRLIDETV